MPKQDLTTRQGVVDAGQRVFERVEALLDAVHEDVGKLREVWRRGHELGLVGAIATGKADADIRAAAGKIAEALSAIYDLHDRGTKIAQVAGLELAQPAAGGPR